MTHPNADLTAEPLDRFVGDRIERLERENAGLESDVDAANAHIGKLEQQIALLRPAAERAEERQRDMEVTRHTLEDLIAAARPRKRILEAALARIACLESEHASRVVERNEALERARQVDAALLVAVAEGNALRVAAVRTEQLEQEMDRARAREESLQAQIRALQTELGR